MSWHKLVVRNDWENITVHIGGPVVGGVFKTNLPLADCPPELRAGDYEVRWPDGHREFLPVVMRSYSSRVYDMGHEYPVSGKRPYFKITHHGVSHVVPAEDLGVEVWLEPLGK